MTLAAILAVFLLNVSPTTVGYSVAPAVTTLNSSLLQSPGGSSSQEAPAQPPSAPTQASPDQASPNQPKPAPKPHHRKKKSTANCTTATPAPNSAEDSAVSKPCPPPKKVVRHGGSEEPAVKVTGGTSTEQAVHQRSTEQLKLATEENLKKIEGRQLSPNQLEMKNQIQQFLEQSNTAAAAGDLDRAHSLGLKAYLLSDELMKP